ncbi:MAG: NosD domain-containing protein, partial [Candidatus Heimdallarchaeaceae archaeon]
MGFFVNISNQVLSSPYGQLILANSEKITIANQYMTNMPTGLELHHCSNIDVRNITIYQSSYEGIYIEDSHYLSFSDLFVNSSLRECFIGFSSSYLYINQSRFSYAQYAGLSLEMVTNSSISYNIFDNNRDYGVYLYETGSIVLFGNDFLFNGYAQAYDDSPQNNSWFNPVLQQGNCFSDWNGSTTYAVETDSGYTFDLYPLNDTDNDSLNDSIEVFLYGTNPFLADSDADGLSDSQEIELYSTDPLLNDTEGDGMPDGWEIEYGLNPLTDDANEDPDNDNLSNLDEWSHQT